MTALGIPSTRSLAAVMSGETVARETPLAAAYFEDEDMTRVIVENTPLGRWGQPPAISTAFVSSPITSSLAITLRPVVPTARISRCLNLSLRDRQSSLPAGCSSVSFTAS